MILIMVCIWEQVDGGVGELVGCRVDDRGMYASANSGAYLFVSFVIIIVAHLLVLVAIILSLTLASLW